MAAHFFLAASVITLFLLVVPAHALAGPDDWDDFSNNFATDLAPILVLFGEQASKQFLSESTSIWDCIIFGIAPIGVITAVVSVIRLYGSSSLKAFIGRAQEAHGVAEAELCSSTSDDVCELWSNGGICRVFGRPLILEFFRIAPRPDDFYPHFEGRTVDTTTPPSCGLYPPKTVVCATEPDRTTGWEEIGGTEPEVGKARAAEDGMARDFAPHPNLSLNIGIKPLPHRFLRLITALGTLFQVSFFAYATWVTFYYPELYDEGELPTLWSFCLATAGTVILVIGMICCAMLVEGMSTERRFQNKTSKTSTTMFWLQPGGQRVGDQLFNAFAYSKSGDAYITSWKADVSVDSQRRPGSSRLSQPRLGLGIAISSSCCGFICQFVGLRGLHGSVALYQLAVTLCMAIVRALLRSRRLSADQNRLKQRRDIEGHELDWQALNIEKMADDEFKGGWYIDDVPSPLKRPDDIGSGAQEKLDTRAHDYGVDVAPGTCGLAGFHVQRQRDIDRVQSARAAVSLIKRNESDGSKPNEGARVMHYRASLACLTGSMIWTEEERWNTKTRAMARQLQKALQEAAEYVFLDMALLKGWRESSSLVWSTTCRLHEPPTMSGDSGFTARTESLPIHFSMHHNAGRWEISECQLEAALGLWSFSMRQLSTSVVDRISRRKVFMAERLEGRDSLVSAIRLWVTQTHGIDKDLVKLDQPAAPDRGAAPDDGDSNVASPDTKMAHNFPTTLSIPLMMATKPHTEDSDDLDGICLSISTQSSLLQLMAQDIFGIFISRIADIMEPLTVAEPWTRRSQMSGFGGGDVTADQSYLGLTNTHVRVLADTMVSSGIGSREDALMTVIPPLLQRAKLPKTSEVMVSLLRVAKDLRRNKKLSEAENLLRWLIDNVPRELQERAVRALGNLYRNAVRSNDLSDQRLGNVGFEEMKAMATLSEGRTIFEESERAMSSYIAAWGICKEARANEKRPLRELVATLPDTRELARALCVADTHDLHSTHLADASVVLDWAIAGQFPELIEDMWSTDLIRGLIDADTLASSNMAPLLRAIDQQVDVETLETLLEWPGMDLVLKGPGGTRALISASKSGNYEFINLLLQRGVSLHNENTRALVSAVGNRHKRVVHRLLSAGAYDSGTARGFLTMALHSAIGWDNTIVKLLLEHQANPNGRCEEDRTALHLAVLAGDVEAVKELLRHGAQVDLLDKNGASSTLLAVQLDKPAILKLLISRSSQATMGQFLRQAVASGSKAIVDLLLAKLAGKKDIIDGSDGQTPLLVMAAKMEREDIVETLLEAGASPNTFTPDQSNGPLHAAIGTGNERIISIVLDQRYNADVDLRICTGQTPLAVAVELGQRGTVKQLLQRGAAPNADLSKNGTVLHLATEKKSCDIVRLLLEYSADANAKDGNGRTPLLTVLEAETIKRDDLNEAIALMLLRAGADANAEVEITTEKGCITITALHLAVRSGNASMVGLLARYHVNVEVRNEMGLTPLLAILNPCQRLAQNQLEMVRILLAADADACVSGGIYGNPLQAAAHHGGEFLVYKLLQHKLKVDVNAEGGYYGSALQAAAAAWAGEEVVELLLHHGADPSARGGAYGSPLLAALLCGHKKVLEILLRRGADTEATHPESGLTALLVAVKRGDVDMISLLLRHTADMESVDEKGRTALLLAAGTGNIKVVEILLDGGADKEAREPTSGCTPLLVASDRGDYDMVRLLLERGADANAEGGIYGNVMRAALYRQDGAAEEMIMSFGGTAEMQEG